MRFIWCACESDANRIAYASSADLDDSGTLSPFIFHVEVVDRCSDLFPSVPKLRSSKK
jgi:hypothetical protein